jgi:ribosomal protein S18 acetylase RimI-like enzyme
LTAPPGERIERVRPDDPRVTALRRAYVLDEVLAPLGLEDEFNTAETPPSGLVPPDGEFLLVLVDGEPAAVGGIRDLDTDVAEIKSMYVAPAGRGRGLAKRLLARLEEIAAERGCRAVRLDSASHMSAAIALYRGLGYREIPPFNDGPIADHWFERELG